MTGRDLIRVAEPHIGEQYIFGTLVPKNDPKWDGPWDCAEFCSWCVYQVSKRLYGCLGYVPFTADAYTGRWWEDVHTKGNLISINKAAATPGAFVLRVGTKVGHIVMSDGKGRTIEAMDAQRGVTTSTLQGRRWSVGITIPWIDYPEVGEVVVHEPTVTILRLTSPNMKGSKVMEVQSVLRDLGFDVGPVDGLFGHKTYNAVVMFQEVHGLVVDGEVGPQTAQALGIKL